MIEIDGVTAGEAIDVYYNGVDHYEALGLPGADGDPGNTALLKSGLVGIHLAKSMRVGCAGRHPAKKEEEKRTTERDARRERTGPWLIRP